MDMTAKEQQQKREDFNKQIEQLMNDANDLWERIAELRDDLDGYLTDLEEGLDEDEGLDEEDENLQEALRYITKAADEIGGGSEQMDWAYEATEGIFD